MDYIKKIASIIAESGDEPSYDDILTLCKKTGKEPDEDTMSPEEYAKLGDAEKEEIHKAATTVEPDDLSDEEAAKLEKLVSDEYWDSERGAGEMLKKLDLPRDEEGKRIEGKEGEKPYRTMLFVLEDYVKWDDKETRHENGVVAQDATHPYMKIGTLQFDTNEQAEDVLKTRFNALTKKFSLDPAKLKKLDVEALPKEIRRQDPNAYGYFYYDTEGEGRVEHRKRGPKKSGEDAEETSNVTFEKKTKTFCIEYIVYRSPSVIKSSGEELIKIIRDHKLEDED